MKNFLINSFYTVLILATIIAVLTLMTMFPYAMMLGLAVAFIVTSIVAVYGIVDSVRNDR